MDLLILNKENRLEINPLMYSLVPFANVFNRDKTSTKVTAIAEISFIYFMEDPRSDFQDILDESERYSKVISSLFLPKGWKEDNVVIEARKFYKERQETLTIQLYEACKIGVSKLKDYVKTVDLNERDERNKPMFNAKQLSDLIKDIGNTIDNVEKLEGKVRRDLSARNNVRGSKSKSMLEDGGF